MSTSFYEADLIHLSAAKESLRRLPNLQWLPLAAISLVVVAICLVGLLLWQLYLFFQYAPPAEPLGLAAIWPSSDLPPRETRRDFTMVGSFESGQATPTSEKLEWRIGGRTVETCDVWSELTPLGDSRAPLLVVITGGHDLTPLNAKTRTRFDSNHNLAWQRAEFVAKRLTDCPSKRSNALVMTIVRGSMRANNAQDRSARIAVLAGS